MKTKAATIITSAIAPHENVESAAVTGALKRRRNFIPQEVYPPWRKICNLQSKISNYFPPSDNHITFA